MTLTLIHSPRSRSSSFVWLLEELDAPYEMKKVTIRRGDGTGALDPPIRIRTARCLPFSTTAY